MLNSGDGSALAAGAGNGTRGISITRVRRPTTELYSRLYLDFTGENAGRTTTLLIHCGNGFVFHKTYYITRHCTKVPCTLPHYSSLAQVHASHSLPFLHFAHASPFQHSHLSLAVACCVSVCLLGDCESEWPLE